MKTSVILLTFLLSFGALAFQVDPYETAKITKEQFLKYHASVADELSASHRSYPQHNLEVFSDEITRASIAFTLPDHPAYPAWVTRHIIENEQGVQIGVIGFFAGDEAEFAKLFGQYKAMAEQTTRELNR